MVLVDPQSPPTYASALSMSNVKVSPPTTPEKLSHGGAPTLSPSTTTSSISTVEQPHAEEQPTAFCVPGSGSLEGWLHKKHAHAKMLGSQWAKRCAPPLQHRQKDAPAARTAAASAAPHRHRIASTVAGARTQLSQQPQLPVSALATLVPHASPCGARYAFIHEERGLLIISKKPDKTKPFWHKDHTCATGPQSPPECPPGPSISRAA